MGRVKKGILDGFSGKVGTVVGSSWRGVEVMRSLPPSTNSSNTPAQASQKAKFSLMSKFLLTMKDLLETGFRDFANKMTGLNSALAYNIKNAVTGISPNFSIVYSEVLISRGSLPKVSLPVAAAGASGVVAFTWANNTGIGKAKADDKAILVAFCPELDHTTYAIGALRSAGAGTLNVPELKGKVVQTWISFVSADDKDIATSVFSGQVTVAP
jgi:Family of unknown function (DUF6266)